MDAKTERDEPGQICGWNPSPNRIQQHSAELHQALEENPLCSQRKRCGKKERN